MGRERSEAVVAKDVRLGRHPEWDKKSREYPIRALLPKKLPVKTSSIHRCPVHLDQGQVGSCVGNGFTHARATTPHAHTKGMTEATALEVYHQATLLDRIAGSYPPEDTGSSVLAGAKATTKMGWWTSYHWAFSIDDVVDTLLHSGPVVVGTNWHQNMFDCSGPDYLLDISGDIVGGHCYLLRGVTLGGHLPGQSAPVDFITIRNSWSKTWGKNSDAHILVTDMESLLMHDGEAVVPVQE